MEPEKLSGSPESLTHQPEINQSDLPEGKGLDWIGQRIEKLKRSLFDGSLLPPSRSSVVGTANFNLFELSEEGKKLHEVLKREAGDTDLLPQFADQFGFDLDAAMEELRGQGILDEN